jgi:hypothetical protein
MLCVICLMSVILCFFVLLWYYCHEIQTHLQLIYDDDDNNNNNNNNSPCAVQSAFVLQLLLFHGNH